MIAALLVELGQDEPRTADHELELDFDWTGVSRTVVTAGGGLSKPLLLLRARGGYIGCGLIDLRTSNKLGEVAAVVRGVNVPEDILRGQCVEVSEAAAECGIHIGMIGRVALELMKGLPPTSTTPTSTAGVGVGSKL